MPLRRERPEQGVEVLRLDRPEVRNALDTPAIAELTGALAELAGDPALGALVLSTTSTVAFCAGADVGEPLDEAGGVARMEAFSRLYATLEAFPAPVVCVCVGDVVGAGAELATGCDLRVGGDNLRMGWVGARLGVPVGPARLVPLVGNAVAADLLLTSRTLDQAAAERAGLLHRTAPAAQAETVALELAAAVAANPGARATKALIRALDLERGALARVARENAGLEAWQRDGAGLPQGRR